MASKQCLTDHAYVAWSQQATVAAGKTYLLHKLRCGVCGAEVALTETPTDIENRKQVEAGEQGA